MSGPEAAERERVKLAERWLALPGNEALRLHAADDLGCWYARNFPSEMESHGLILWADLKRALGVEA